MRNKTYEHKIEKILIVIVLMIISAIVVIKILPYFKLIINEEGRQIFKQQIQKLGKSGYLVIIGLLILKALFIFFPGEPLEILAGMCYGTWGGLLIVYIGIAISTCLIFLLIRIFGKNFVYTFVSKKKIKKLKNSRLYKSKKIEMILMILFIVPRNTKRFISIYRCCLRSKAIKFYCNFNDSQISSSYIINISG